MKKFFFILVLLFLLSSFAIFYYNHKPIPEKPLNLVVITIDTLRADRLGCYGYKKAQTPCIDKLAKEGVLFTSLYAQSPLTLPSHSSILTGTCPSFHGVRDNHFFRLPPNIPTIATILKKYGYQTAAVVSSDTVSRSKGLDRGFDEYDDVPESLKLSEGKPNYVRERLGKKSVEAALEQLKRFEKNPKKPFFMWLHLFDPHAEYRPPSPFREKCTHPYDGEIAYADHCLSLFLKALKKNPQFENTILVITADHGESLGEHGEKSHGYFLYNSSLHIPLVFHCKKWLPKSHKVTIGARTIDLLPTIFGLMNIKDKGLSQGADLSSLVLNHRKEYKKKLPIYSEAFLSHYAFGWSPLRSFMIDGHRYIASGRGELYSVSSDSNELENLLLKHRKTPISQLHASQLKKQLKKYLFNMQSKNFHALRVDSDALTSGTQTYPSQPPKNHRIEEFTQNSSPHDMVCVLKKFIKAQSYMALKKDQKAILEIQKILGQKFAEFEKSDFVDIYIFFQRFLPGSNPICAYIRKYLPKSFFSLSHEKKVEAFVSTLNHICKTQKIYDRARFSGIKLRKYPYNKLDAEKIPIVNRLLLEDAFPNFIRRGSDPKNLAAWSILGKLYERQRKLNLSLAAYQRWHDLRPDLRIAKEAILDILVQLNRRKEAYLMIEEILEKDSTDAVALSRLAYLHLQNRKYRHAYDAAKKAVRYNRRLPSAHFYRGQALLHLKEFIHACESFRQAIALRPNWAKAYFYQGICLWKSKYKKRAKKTFKKALFFAKDPILKKKIKMALFSIQ